MAEHSPLPNNTQGLKVSVRNMVWEMRRSSYGPSAHLFIPVSQSPKA